METQEVRWRCLELAARLNRAYHSDEAILVTAAEFVTWVSGAPPRRPVIGVPEKKK